MPAIRKYFRLILIILLLLTGLILTILFLRKSNPARGFTSTIITTWLGLVARTLGLKITTFGSALPEKVLFVANHISWLDILVLGSLTPIHFLSKHEVKEMPVIGWLATRAGTLYIKRGKNGSASYSSSEITAILKKRHNSLIFAEGTTTDGHVKRFHSRLMQSAIDAHATVQPVAIFYPAVNSETQRTELNPATLFVGDISIIESIDLVFREPAIEVEVHYLEPIHCSGRTRDEIARHAYDEVIEIIEQIKNRTAER